jgi:hypothetical protein
MKALQVQPIESPSFSCFKDGSGQLRMTGNIFGANNLPAVKAQIENHVALNTRVPGFVRVFDLLAS